MEKKSRVKVPNTIQMLIPIVSYDDNLSAFCRPDGSYFDLMQVSGRDLNALKEEDVWHDIQLFTRFYRTCTGDIKWISMNYPTDVSAQLEYWLYKLRSSQSPLFQQWIQREIAKLEYITEHRADKEYYLMLFGKNEDELTANRSIASSRLGSFLQTIPLEKKLRILEKYCNQTDLIGLSRVKEDEM